MFERDNVRDSYRIDDTSLLPKRFQFRDSFIQWYQLPFRLCFRIIAVANIDGTGLLLLRSHDYNESAKRAKITISLAPTKDKIILLQLTSPDLLRHCVSANVNVGM